MLVAKKEGLTLIELIIAMAILVIALTGVFALLIHQTKTSYKEARKTESLQSNIIAELVVMRDVSMAGLGMPKEYNNSFVPIDSNNNVSYGQSEYHDELIIKGPIISSKADTFMKWGYNYSYIQLNSTSVDISTYPETCISSPSDPQCSSFPSFPNFSSSTNSSGENEKIVFIDAETKELLGNNGVYKVYPVTGIQTSNHVSTVSLGENTNFSIRKKGSLIFSIGYLKVTENQFSNYLSGFTGYKLTSSPSSESICAPGTRTLIRVYGGGKDPVMDCVLDFQVEFGYVSSSGVTWLNSLPNQGNYPELVRVDIVIQQGKKDPKYQYSSSTIQTADNTITLSSEQKHYHWRTIKLVIPLREVE